MKKAKIKFLTKNLTKVSLNWRTCQGLKSATKFYDHWSQTFLSLMSRKKAAGFFIEFSWYWESVDYVKSSKQQLSYGLAFTNK